MAEDSPCCGLTLGTTNLGDAANVSWRTCMKSHSTGFCALLCERTGGNCRCQIDALRGLAIGAANVRHWAELSWQHSAESGQRFCMRGFARACAAALGRNHSPLRTFALSSARCHSPGSVASTPLSVFIDDVMRCAPRVHAVKTHVLLDCR